MARIKSNKQCQHRLEHIIRLCNTGLKIQSKTDAWVVVRMQWVGLDAHELDYGYYGCLRKNATRQDVACRCLASTLRPPSQRSIIWVGGCVGGWVRGWVGPWQITADNSCYVKTIKQWSLKGLGT